MNRSSASRLWRWMPGSCLLLFCGCAHDFAVRPADPLRAQDEHVIAPHALRASETALWSGVRAQRHGQPAVAAGFYVRALELLATSPSYATTCGQVTEVIRFTTSRLVDLYGSSLLAVASHRLRVTTGPGRFFLLSLRRGEGPGGMEPACFTDVKSVDDFAVTRVDRYSGVRGEGAPLVGSLRPVLPVNSAGLVPPVPVAGFERAVTAVVTVVGNASPTVVLDLYDPHTTGQAPGCEGVTCPLAANYTTPLALELAHFRPQRRGLFGLMRGGDYFPSTGLYALEKPTPDKRPLVFVHGLISDPGDFHVLYNDLEADAEVRRRYQMWIFYYPTSLPVPYAAMLLREDLENFIHQLDPQGTHPALHRSVLVGHSMGGLLCRMAISDGGNRYYHFFFRQPVDELKLSPRDRRLVRRAFYYRACPDVAQVVFIATPQRGSSLASGLLGEIGRLLSHMPSAVRLRLSSILVQNRSALADNNHLQPGSSLDSLTPSGPVIKAVNAVRMSTTVRLHSILGDQGRGGPPERSSDGVVPYRSSHLAQAESEVFVPAGHIGTLKRPETAAELTRILRSAPAKWPESSWKSGPQISALRSRLEKQPTDLRQNTLYFGAGH